MRANLMMAGCVDARLSGVGKPGVFWIKTIISEIKKKKVKIDKLIVILSFFLSKERFSPLDIKLISPCMSFGIYMKTLKEIAIGLSFTSYRLKPIARVTQEWAME
jgi:hypothetical protein